MKSTGIESEQNDLSSSLRVNGEGTRLGLGIGMFSRQSRCFVFSECTQTDYARPKWTHKGAELPFNLLSRLAKHHYYTRTHRPQPITPVFQMSASLRCLTEFIQVNDVQSISSVTINLCLHSHPNPSSPHQSAIMSSRSARAQADAERRFISALQGWKLANQELQGVIEQRQRLTSELEELTLLMDEMAHLEPHDELYRMVGPIMQPVPVAQGREQVAARRKRVEEDRERMQRREQALSIQQKKMRMELSEMQRQLPHIPDSIYSV